MAIKQDRITLKNIKHFAAGSEETHCYTASLYVDGKKIGEVGNDGHGGPDRFYGDTAAFSAADKWAAECLPKWGSEYGDKDDMDQSLEIICGDLVNEWLVAKDAKAQLTKSVLFVKDGELLTISFKGCRKVGERHIAHVRAECPDAKILNEMPQAEAIALFAEMLA